MVMAGGPNACPECGTPGVTKAKASDTCNTGAVGVVLYYDVAAVMYLH
jgi:hypothetical protein